MNIRVLFFAKVKEELGNVSELAVAIDDADNAPITVQTLIDSLSLKGEKWRAVLADNEIKMSVNHQLASPQSIITHNAEVAFFPAMTGG